MQRHLSVRFKTLDEAEEFYQIDYFEGQETYNFDPISSTSVKDQSGADVPVSSCLSPVFQQSLSEVKGQEMVTGDLIRVMTDGYLKMTNRQRLQFLSFLFSMSLCYDVGVDGNFVPSDFIQLAGNSFKQLQAAGVKNMVYFLVRSVGALRSDGSGPRMPLDQMPFGLIHHNLEFFSNDNCTNLHPVDHYAEWQTTMFAHFGHKWDKLFRGAMWSYDGETSDEDDMSSIGDAAAPEIQRQRYLWLAKTCFHKQQHPYYRRQKSMWPVKTCLRKQQAPRYRRQRSICTDQWPLKTC